jgi:hypothetical protein
MIDPIWLDFLEFVALHNDRWVFFRGQANALWPLIPGIARQDKNPRGIWRPALEKRLFDDFKRLAGSFDPGIGYLDLDWLGMAQHFGLPTRLLDWTENPLVAAWFAVADETTYRSTQSFTPIPALVHVIRVDPNKVLPSVEPFLGSGPPVVVQTPARVARITAQHGLFSVHRSPTVPWTPSSDGHAYERFEIPHASKAFFRMALHQFGFNRQRLMTDLESLCVTLTWGHINGR